jgi:hypothetical protein
MKGIIDGQAEAVFITNTSIPAKVGKKKKKNRVNLVKKLSI